MITQKKKFLKTKFFDIFIFFFLTILLKIKLKKILNLKNFKKFIISTIKKIFNKKKRFKIIFFVFCYFKKNII